MTLGFRSTGLGVPGSVRAELAGDPPLRGPQAPSGAPVRPAWSDVLATSRELVGRLAELRTDLQFEGLDRVVSCGSGGSSPAAEVVRRAAGVPLVVLDTTDPHRVATAMGDLDRTAVVVGATSGGTVETDSQRRAFMQAFAAAGLDDKQIGARFVVVTDPGSPLSATAAEMGAREVFLADPDVGGPGSALSAFVLVPAALAGADVGALLEEAAELAEQLAEPGNAALELGLAMGAGARAGRDEVTLVDGDPAVAGFGGWVEQLIAGATGTDGRGLLPVVVESPDAPGATGPDALLAVVGGDPVEPGPSVGVTGPLGAQFLGWQYATAVAWRVLGIDPSGPPGGTDPEEITRRLLDAGLPDEPPLATIGAVELRAPGGLLEGVDLSQLDGVTLALQALLAAVPPRGYLAVTAHLDRGADARAGELRAALARRTGHAVTFGWGSRPTGRHDGDGPRTGAFLQITGAVHADLPIPGRPYTFGTLQAAQAAGGRQALAARRRPLLHLHLTDRAAGVDQLLDALG